jgi:hypothetical protein
MKRFLAAVAVFAFPSLAWGQSAVTQGGSWTSGHVPKYNQTGGSQPMVTDGGTSAGGAVGANPSTFGITARGTGTPPYVGQGAGPNGENFCIYDAPTTNATGYHSLCFDPNIGSKATISTQAGGAGSAQGLQFIIDGTTYDFPDDFPTIPVTVPNGGTGLTSLTANNLLIGAGKRTDAVAAVFHLWASPGFTGNRVQPGIWDGGYCRRGHRSNDGQWSPYQHSSRSKRSKR